MAEQRMEMRVILEMGVDVRVVIEKGVIVGVVIAEGIIVDEVVKAMAKVIINNWMSAVVEIMRALRM